MIDLEVLADEMACRPISRLKRLDRWVQLLKGFRASQIARRGRALVLRRLRPHVKVGSDQPSADLRTCNFTSQQREAAQIVLSDYARHISHSQSRVTDGLLTLLNETKSVGWPIDWDKFDGDSSVTHLWRFQLHYHEYWLSYLADDNSPEAWSACWSAIENWIEAYTPATTSKWLDAWHPYCISRRIQVWLFLLALKPPAELVMSKVVRSLWQQSQHLSRNLELDLGGNHLMENLTALAMTSRFLDCPQRENWAKLVLRHLPCELKSQVLSHGEHFERAPAYHCQVLGSLHRIWIFGPTDTIWNDLRGQLPDVILRMSQFLQAITHCDGHPPLLSDSVSAESPSSSQLAELARVSQSSWEPESTGRKVVGPYYIVRGSANSFSIIVDTGDIAAGNLPAHGHADWMNLTATYHGEPWLVDSGNFDYEDSPIRHYCRSSIAHSVMTVDRENHCDLWSKFRMVRMGQCIQRKVEDIDGILVVQVTYDCYRRRFGCLLGRSVLMNQAGDVVVIDMADSLRGYELMGYVHLSPQIQLAWDAEHKNSLWATSDRDSRRLFFFNCAEVQKCQGWYCPAFGVRRRKPVLEYRGGKCQGSNWLAWTLTSQELPTIQSLSVDGHALSVKWGEWQSTIEFWPRHRVNQL